MRFAAFADILAFVSPPTPTPPPAKLAELTSTPSRDEIALAHTATSDGGPTPARPCTRLGRGDGLGRYTIVETLGEGGMGVVYGAYDPDLDRKVALKLLRGAEGTVSEGARARLLREARAMAKLSHNNVIRVYEVDSVGRTDFVAMEFIDGGDLGHWLGEERDWRHVLRVFAQAGRGLAAAHRGGLVHRDFKPANVLMAGDGRVVVTDFGLAQVNVATIPAEESGSDAAGQGAIGDTLAAGLTRTGALVGTPAYMAPEQHRRQAVDHRSDQFSFCVALYEALYAERPFDGESIEQLCDAAGSGRVRPEPKGSKVPTWVRKIVLRGLSPQPEDRFASMDELLGHLRRDPGRLRRRLVAAGILSITAAGMVYAFSAGSGGSNEAAVCASGEAGFAGVWDGVTRASLQARFDGAGPVGAAAFEKFAGTIDDYKARWKRSFVDSCEAVRVTRAHSEDDLHLQTGCLLQRREALRTLVEVFGSVEPSAVVEHATVTAGGLPAIGDCDDLDALRRGVAPPSDPHTRKRVEALRAELARGRVLQEAMQLTRALEVALEVADKAQDIDYPPVRAEALLRLGKVQSALDHPSLARQALEEAQLLAEETGHNEVVARALVARVAVEVEFSSKSDETRQLARHARAAVSRFGRDRTLDARLDTLLAGLLLEEKRDDEARVLLLRALESYRSVPGRELDVADVKSSLLATQLRGARYDRALATAREILRAVRGKLGEAHPRTAQAHEVVAAVLRSRGDYVAAGAERELAAVFWQSPRGQEVLAPYHAAARRGGTRRVTGQVIGADGRPAAGVLVVAGDFIIGDGHFAYVSGSAKSEAAAGIGRAVTGADGRFTIDEVGVGSQVLIAEHEDGGRSEPHNIDGSADVRGIEMRLRPFGTLVGTIRVKGKQARNLGVSALGDKGAMAYIAAATTRPDGSYALRLSAGTHNVIAGSAEQRASRFESEQVVIRAGQETRRDFVLDSVGVNVDLQVRGKQGAVVDNAQVFVFEREMSVRTAAALNKAFLDNVAAGGGSTGFVQRRTVMGAIELHLEFNSLSPGAKSFCVIPITGDLKDPEFARRINAAREQLAVYCQRIQIKETPARQDLVIEVPAMRPLPVPREER